jgi:hypothetical protein
VQVISGVVTTDDGLPSGDDSQQLESFEQLNPVSPRGIDSDEIAELVAMHRVAVIRFGNVDSQSFANSLFGEGSLGININAEAEEPTSISANAPTAEITDEGDFVRRIASINEPGTLDNYGVGGSIPYVDASSGAGGTGQAMAKERFFNFKNNLGTGPYVDYTDDLSLFQELEVNEVTDQAELETRYTLYWSVEEMPEGRASFSRP